MIKFAFVSAIIAILSGPLNCSSGSGQPDPPVNIVAPSSAK